MAALVPVEEAVGRTEERRVVLAGLPLRDPEAQLQRLARRRAERLRAQGLLDAGGDLSRLGDAGLGHRDGELVAAEPGRHVRGADRLADDDRDGADRLVAGVVPEAIVDLLQV